MNFKKNPTFRDSIHMHTHKILLTKKFLASYMTSCCFFPLHFQCFLATRFKIEFWNRKTRMEHENKKTEIKAKQNERTSQIRLLMMINYVFNAIVVTKEEKQFIRDFIRLHSTWVCNIKGLRIEYFVFFKLRFVSSNRIDASCRSVDHLNELESGRQWKNKVRDGCCLK